MVCSVALVASFLIHPKHKVQLLATLALVNQIEETDATGWEKNSKNPHYPKTKSKLRNRAIQNPKSEGFRPTISSSITGNYF